MVQGRLSLKFTYWKIEKFIINLFNFIFLICHLFCFFKNSKFLDIDFCYCIWILIWDVWIWDVWNKLTVNICLLIFSIKWNLLLNTVVIFSSSFSDLDVPVDFAVHRICNCSQPHCDSEFKKFLGISGLCRSKSGTCFKRLLSDNTVVFA